MHRPSEHDEDEVGVAGDVVALLDGGVLAHPAAEVVERPAVFAFQLDSHHEGHGQAQGARFDHGDLAGDDPGLPQPLDAAAGDRPTALAMTSETVRASCCRWLRIARCQGRRAPDPARDLRRRPRVARMAGGTSRDRGQELLQARVRDRTRRGRNGPAPPGPQGRHRTAPAPGSSSHCGRSSSRSTTHSRANSTSSGANTTTGGLFTRVV